MLIKQLNKYQAPFDNTFEMNNFIVVLTQISLK